MQGSINVSFVLDVLEHIWAENKAKGHVSELMFTHNLKNTGVNFIGGVWLLSPHSSTPFWTYRHAFYLLPFQYLSKIGGDVEDAETLISRLRWLGLWDQLKHVFDFLERAGIQPVLVVPSVDLPAFWGVLRAAVKNAQNTKNSRMREFAKTLIASGTLKFNLFAYKHGNLRKYDLASKKHLWGGGRGARPPNWRTEGWSTATRQRIQNALGNQLDKALDLLLWELFYSVYFKTELGLPAQDPYDIDGFILVKCDDSTAVFPVEIKEKEPYCPLNSGKRKTKYIWPQPCGSNKWYFGIDVGRLTMLLRLVAPQSERANAIYFVHHVRRTPSTESIGWRAVTLGRILMDSPWQGTAGGTSMKGGSTQTVYIPYDSFQSVNFTQFSSFMCSISVLSSELDTLARRYIVALRKYFGI